MPHMICKMVVAAVVVEAITIQMEDGSSDGLRLAPSARGTWPGVLLYPDAFGIRQAVVDLASNICQMGYVVLVPNVFYRFGRSPLIDLPSFIDRDSRASILTPILGMIDVYSEAEVLSDGAHLLQFLTDDPQVSESTYSVVGYCIGGKFGVATAASFPELVGSVSAFHAPISSLPDEVLSGVGCPFHFGHSADDVTADSLAALNSRLVWSWNLSCSEVYADTIHGFTMRDTFAYSAAGLGLHERALTPMLEHAALTPLRL